MVAHSRPSRLAYLARMASINARASASLRGAAICTPNLPGGGVTAGAPPQPGAGNAGGGPPFPPRPRRAIWRTGVAPPERPSVTSNSLEGGRPAAPTRTDRVPLGILYMLGATILFAASSALSKWQVASHFFIDVLFLRSVTALVMCSLLILPRTGL